MRIVPRSLAGRLAALLVLTLIAAQIVAFALFSGERISAFRTAYREDLLTRLVSLVAFLEEAPAELHDRLIATASSTLFRTAVEAEPALDADETGSPRLRSQIAAALGKPEQDVRIAFWETRWRDRNDNRAREHWHGRHGPPSWVQISVRLADGNWLNGTADRPPVPPMGRAFLASFVISAVAVAVVGAFGVRLASGPLRKLATAADRLGRGESFEPLPETGPLETGRANSAFNRMRERLDRFIRDRTAMLAAVGHDLRTPITSLRLRVEFIEDEETRTKVLETLAEMQAMAEAVLAFARGDAESEPSRRTEIAALAESIVEDAAASGRDVRMEESSPAVLTCRPFALRRAIGNLIDNATFHGKRARVKVETHAGEVRIIIDDEGPGIPDPDLERVFDPFVRLESSRSRETGGAGLGLSIARSIVRAHGGDVRLENRAEGGLRAIVSLPT